MRNAYSIIIQHVVCILPIWSAFNNSVIRGRCQTSVVCRCANIDCDGNLIVKMAGRKVDVESNVEFENDNNARVTLTTISSRNFCEMSLLWCHCERFGTLTNFLAGDRLLDRDVIFLHHSLHNGCISK